MHRPQDVTEMMRLAAEAAMLAMEAQMIVALRLGGMAGWWNVAKSENGRMVTEKIAASQAAAAAVGRAMLAGATPAGLALAAMEPVRVKTTANAKRLMARGFKV